MPRGSCNRPGARGGANERLAAEGYSTREAARLCDLSPRQVRALARAGVVGPRPPPGAAPPRGRRRLRFSFVDLPVLRTVRRLLTAGLPLAQIGRALRALRAQLARRRLPLSAVCCEAEAGHVVADDGEARWDAHSGAPAPAGVLAGGRGRMQAALVPLLATVPAPRIVRARGIFGEKGPFGDAYAFDQADHWFGRGLRAERVDPRRACGHYLRAIACDPEHVEAMINLGHVCAAEGDGRRAASFFRLATRVDPGHAVAQYNLAVMFHDAGERGAAMQAYRRALLLDPHFADAHYNLGTLLAEQGHSAEAGTHFSAFHAASRPSPP